MGRSQNPVSGRAWLGFLLGNACAVHAQAARAQGSQDKHHLIATAGNPFQSDNEVDRFDGRAEFVWQNGVQGVNPNFFFHEAVADGDAGVHGSGALADGNNSPSSGSVQAGLRVNMCAVGFQKTFYSSGFGEGTPSDSCSNTAHVTNIASAGAGSLSITQTMDGSALPTRFYVTAQVEGEANYLGQFDSGEYVASGTLSIEVAGVGYRFSSPTFLTVPEPGNAALGAAALAALGALGRRVARLH